MGVPGQGQRQSRLDSCGEGVKGQRGAPAGKRERTNEGPVSTELTWKEKGVMGQRRGDGRRNRGPETHSVTEIGNR